MTIFGNTDFRKIIKVKRVGPQSHRIGVLFEEEETLDTSPSLLPTLFLSLSLKTKQNKTKQQQQQKTCEDTSKRRPLRSPEEKL